MSGSSLFVRLLVGFLLSVTGACCPIELSPARVVVKYGDPVSVNCSTWDTQHEGMGWEAALGGTGNSKVNHSTWTVANLSDWTLDSECFINPSPELGGQCSRSPVIVIYTIPGKVSINSSGDIPTCEVLNVAPVQNLTVKWYKDNELFQTNRFTSSTPGPKNLSSPLRYKPTTEDNGVRFRCEAFLDLSPEGPQFNQSSEEYTIDIRYPPSQILELEDLEFTVGSSVSLTCSAFGNPRPQYSWIYYRTTNVLEENKDGVSRLLIQNATLYNMGNYTCHAWNEEGNVSKTSRLTVKGAKQVCPLQITPERMVLEYRGESQNVTCEALHSENTIEIYWEGSEENSLTLAADTHNWDSKPVCKARFDGIGPCQKALDFTLYKKPDNVSISIDADNNTLMEGSEYTLVCEITSVAPAQNVRVRWYQGNESFTPVNVSCDMCNNTTKRDVNMLFSTNITANRTLNGAEFTCKAELDLRTEPLLSFVSQPLNITVHYKPSINTTKLQKKVPVISGYTEDLICEADGNPPPMILWISSSGIMTQASKGVLPVTEAGIYNCNATNYVGSITREVEVILKVDYLPLIAGFVAVTVVGISIMFVFIYSIYYKNTKMRRYSLKNPKLNTHNGNVAHNGWDMPFPMTKL